MRGRNTDTERSSSRTSQAETVVKDLPVDRYKGGECRREDERLKRCTLKYDRVMGDFYFLLVCIF